MTSFVRLNALPNPEPSSSGAVWTAIGFGAERLGMRRAPSFVQKDLVTSQFVASDWEDSLERISRFCASLLDQNPIAIGGDVDGFRVFEIGFLDGGGALIQIMPLPAETVTAASYRAAEIASEIDAADFFITSKPAYPQKAPHSPS